jgi:hypothetical protein
MRRRTEPPPSVPDLLAPPQSPPGGQCPATTRYTTRPWPGSPVTYGVQCKYQRGHEGDHAGTNFPGSGDMFWSDDQQDP